MYDFVIVGGGVVGASLSYFLSRYNNTILLIESGKDVSLGASKANSAIIHAGYDPKEGTLKAKLNVKGASLYKSLCEKLGVTYRDQETLVIAKNEEEYKILKDLHKRGEANGVKGGVIIEKEEALKKEPILRSDIAGAYCVPSGVASPYELTVALIEVAQKNGIELRLETTLEGAKEEEGGLVLTVKEKGEVKEIKARYLINCAGVGSEKVANFLGDDSFKIKLVKGEYLLFDYHEKYAINGTLFPVPDPVKGKGVLINLTPDKNILLGPTSDICVGGEDTSTHLEKLEEIWEKSKDIVEVLPPIGKLIRSFSGIRSKIERKDKKKDFLIGFSEKSARLYNVAGIDSPGLSSAPAIALYVIEELKEKGLIAEEKREWIEGRSWYEGRREEKLEILKADEKTRLPLGDSERIVCRCQSVREKTIRDAARRWSYPLTVEGVKRRTRAGMGFCQGSFCCERVKEVLSDEYKVAKEEILIRDEINIPERPKIQDIKKKLLEKKEL